MWVVVAKPLRAPRHARADKVVEAARLSEKKEATCLVAQSAEPLSVELGRIEPHGVPMGVPLGS